MIGSIVRVIVDRPLGSYHPEHKNIYYSVNYGFIPEIIAPDGEGQDAYILGVDEPISEFTGPVLAIIESYNDTEDKWVVAPEGVSYTDDEILRQVEFMEKYFDIKLIT